jgi:hypothetical protein
MNWIEKIEFFRIYNQPIARESTNIDKMSYDDIKKELVVQFQGGATYTYLDVPLEIYKDVVDGKTYDFIIDDGSHRGVDIIASFCFLYDYVKPGGVYIIEDLHPPHAERETTIEKIKEFISKKPYSGIDLVCNDKLLIIRK